MQEATEKTPAWIPWLAVAVVASGGVLGYRYIFNPTDDHPWPPQSATQQQSLQLCRDKLLEIDPQASIPDRPVTGQLIGWGTDSGLVLHGRRATASCSLGQDGRPEAMTIDGKDSP